MTDITGYKSDAYSDGGALMRAVAPQLEHVLTGKAPLLNGPGMVMENSLYYDITSSTVTAVELQETFQKDRIACSVMKPNSSTTCYIPSVLFANTVFLNITLPYDATLLRWKSGAEDKKDHYFMMSVGWGFYFIQSVILYFGACTIAQIEISGESNYLVAMAQCETKSKRQNILAHAGRYLNSLDKRSVLADKKPGMPIFRYRNRQAIGNNLMYSSTVDGVNSLAASDSVYPPLANAMVPIRLPFSSLCALEKRISFDTRLLTQPIQLTFQMRSQASVCKSNIPDVIDTGLANFKSLSVQLWQEELSDKSLSLRSELLRAPDFNVGYPFQYIQSISFPVPTPISGSSPWDPQNFVLMNITSLINSDLTTMLFYVTGNYQRSDVNASAYTPATTVGANSSTGFKVQYNGSDYCALYGVELQSLELKINGQRLYAFDYDTYSAATMAKQIDNESVTLQRPQIGQISALSSNSLTTTSGSIQYFPTGGSNDITLPEMKSYLVNSHYYELNFGKLRSLVLEAHMQNTGRFTNQTFQLSFQIGDIFACQQLPGFDQNSMFGFSGVNATSNSTMFTMWMTYLYNAVLLAGGDGGTTKLITN